MKFLVDAHLPRRLCAVLEQRGHDAKHTLDLPAENATKDGVINQPGNVNGRQKYLWQENGREGFGEKLGSDADSPSG